MFNYKDIGDAVSHEAGHTFGLGHDGAVVNGVTDPYYYGTATWAPIMGVSYDAPLSQWSNGGYPVANNTEDDLAMIAGKAGYRVDDYPNTAATATAVTAHQTITGYVGGPDQADVFAVTVAAGPLDVTLSPSGTLTSNLFATVVVRDAGGAVVATDTPPSPSTAVLIFPLSPVDWRAHVAPVVPAGKYTVTIVPAGLQPATVNGFTSYGAHGSYTLTVAGRDPIANTAPVAHAAVTPSTGVAPLTSAFSGLSSTDVDGDTLTYTWYDGVTLLSTNATTQQTYPTPGTYQLRLVVTDAFGATNESVATVVVVAAPAPAPPPTTTTPVPATPAAPTPATPTPATSPNARLSPVTPMRLADTRVGLAGATRLPAGGVLRLGVAGANGVPSTATAVALNLTAVSPATAGYLTVYPCSASVPVVSTVNFVAGKTIANATIATLSSGGEICVATSTETDVLIDLTGSFASSAANAMTPRNPTRYLDTRSGLGGATRLAAGSAAVVDLPPGEAAVAVNVIAVSPAASGYLTVYPCGSERPNTSSVNFDGGEIRANNAIVATGVGGDICVFTLVESDVVVDLTATFSASGTMAYRPAAPHRLLDTRDASMPASGTTVPYDIPTPGVAFSAASVNVTATDHTRAGFVTTFDCGPLPLASTVNTRVGEANANGAIVPVASSASCLYSSQSAQLIVDLLGWWVPA